MSETTYTQHLGDYCLSTDKSRLDIDVIHHYLSVDSYWAKGIPRHIVEKSLAHSWCFGIYHGNDQVGFGRLTTDYSTFAYLADVFVLPAHRGKGLSKWMMACIMAQPEISGMRRIMLATSDAHGLYAGFGFKPLDAPEKIMQINRPNAYKTP
jgi:GNAT superfamily N-acetyltransferase